VVERVTEAFQANDGKLYPTIQDAEKADLNNDLAIWYNKTKNISSSEYPGVYYAGLTLEEIKSGLPELYEILDRYRQLILQMEHVIKQYK
jgi:hypothetical protein